MWQVDRATKAFNISRLLYRTIKSVQYVPSHLRQVGLQVGDMLLNRPLGELCLLARARYLYNLSSQKSSKLLLFIYFIYLYLKSFSNYNDDELFLSCHLRETNISIVRHESSRE